MSTPLHGIEQSVDFDSLQRMLTVEQTGRMLWTLGVGQCTRAMACKQRQDKQCKTKDHWLELKIVARNTCWERHSLGRSNPLFPFHCVTSVTRSLKKCHTVLTERNVPGTSSYPEKYLPCAWKQQSKQKLSVAGHRRDANIAMARLMKLNGWDIFTRVVGYCAPNFPLHFRRSPKLTRSEGRRWNLRNNSRKHLACNGWTPYHRTPTREFTILVFARFT